MNSHKNLVKVTGEIREGEFDIKISLWKLLIETNRYYEIKPENGAVKRIYKEKLHTIIDESKSYTNGFLTCSAFCIEDRINDMQIEIVQKLQLRISAYIDDLRLNQNAINQRYHLLENNHLLKL
ncbi:hypothetical protein [Paenibacillus endoradicis]|uniref:hypothetical protein n=1 Tax=Paenibacillus endoradicis TaxID=2972487 RepID=UPI002158E85D|nr:hypothetical protein [Paenibacillus endoradicis]MCR8660231.1 hypothetical protein [Paenibacillus endoradicis]